MQIKLVSFVGSEFLKRNLKKFLVDQFMTSKTKKENSKGEFGS